MGSCFSKKTVSSSVNNAASSSSSSSYSAPAPNPNPGKLIARAQEQKKSAIPREGKVTEEVLPATAGAGKEEDDISTKKEIFVIKHRNSHDSNNINSRDKPRSSSYPEVSESDKRVSVDNGKVDGLSTLSTTVRSSSCTKEEVDAILIQCGRLSRSNSFGTPGKPAAGRKYTGSKRSYDFDEQNDRDLHQDEDGGDEDGGDEASARDSRRQHRQRHRQSSRNSSPASQARRRTPSRERDQQRSGSRERGAGSSGNGRRVSRSPGRRSDNTTATAAANATDCNANNNNANGNRPPGKLVSVPPTVSSNKANCNGVDAPQTANSGGIKRISVKRNVGEAAAGSRSVASPRSKSPARTKNEGNQQQPSLSRNSSRKAEQSPHRRNPLAEIDPSSLAYPQATGAKASSSNWAQNEGQMTGKEPIQKQNPLQSTPAVAAESLKQPLTRSRSARRSRDLDINPEILLNPQQTSYTSLLLEDIHNFHSKSNNSNIISSSNNINNIVPSSSSFQLPACVTKACSILEAVADLNSTTSSNLSSTLSEDHHRKPQQQQLSKAKDPFVVESEVVTIDDLVEPSFHKYVTVRRGGGEEEMGMQEESSGSNSIVAGGGGSQQQWGNSYNSGWEPSSADSTDRWSSRDNNNGKEEEKSSVVAPLGLGIGQRVHGLVEKRSSGGREIMGGIEEAARMAFSGQRNGGIGRGRLAASGNKSHHLIAST